MAQGDKFQLAVAYPIMNPNFSLPNRATGTLDIAYTSGLSLSTNGVDPDQGSDTLSFLDLVFKANDRIFVGPSSNTIDINKEESFLLDGSSGSNFTLNSALSFDYEIGDNFYGIGSALAGGWYLQGAGINSSSEADIVVGNFDNYAQKLVHSNTENFLSFTQNLDSSFLIDLIRYRFGFIYKFIDASDSGTFELIIDGLVFVFDAQFSFTEVSQKMIKRWFNGVWQFRLIKPGSGTLTLTLDDVFLEHTFDDFLDMKGEDSGVSRRTVIPATNNGFDNGYYEFDENPDLESVKINKKDFFQTVDFSDKSKSWFDSSGLGDRIEKYSFACKFSDVSQSFFDILLEFDRLQKQGYQLNIHPNIDNLPSVMMGNFKLSNESKNSWDLSLTSFDFQFEEA